MKITKTILAVCLMAMTTAVSAQKTYVHITTESGIKYDIASDTITSMTIDTNAPVTGSTNGHDWVMIGGVKWATMNVGATTVAGLPSTCYGDYYAWSETEPRYSEISITGATAATFTWKSDYSTGYNVSNPPTYTESTLDDDHDAATANWGSKWRTPTPTEFTALYNACGASVNSSTNPGVDTSVGKGIYRCTSYDGIAGILFCDGTNKVFFPATGVITGNSKIENGGVYCGYWQSTSNGTTYGYYFQTNSTQFFISNTAYKAHGHSVRAVLK